MVFRVTGWGQASVAERGIWARQFAQVRKRRASLFAAAILTIFFCGCSRLHSRAITLQLVNRSNAPVSNLAFEFPGGSFGVDTVAPGATRQKWFKPLSTGPLKVEFDDSAGHHSAQLLTLHAGDSGTATATFTGGGEVHVSEPR